VTGASNSEIAGKAVVDRESGAVEKTFIPSIGRNDEGERLDDPRGVAEEPSPLAEGLADEADLAVAEIADATVDQLGALRRGAFGEIRLLKQGGAVAPRRRVQGDGESGRPAPDHEEIPGFGIVGEPGKLFVAVQVRQYRDPATRSQPAEEGASAAGTPKSSRVPGLTKVRIVKIPRAVPKGMKRHSIPAMTRQKVWERSAARCLPARTRQVEKTNPPRMTRPAMDVKISPKSLAGKGATGATEVVCSDSPASAADRGGGA
jgi:hypothetical protein